MSMSVSSNPASRRDVGTFDSKHSKNVPVQLPPPQSLTAIVILFTGTHPNARERTSRMTRLAFVEKAYRKTEETRELGAIARADYDTLFRSQHCTRVGNGLVGRRLFASTSVAQNRCEIEFKGERVSFEEADVRERLHISRDWTDDLMFRIDRTDTVIDTAVYGKMERFANHSCSLNAKFKKFQLASSSFAVVFFVALKNIEVQTFLLVGNNCCISMKRVAAIVPHSLKKRFTVYYP